MVYEPKLPALLDELAQRQSTHRNDPPMTPKLSDKKEDSSDALRAHSAPPTPQPVPPHPPRPSVPPSPPEAVTSVTADTGDLEASAERFRQRHLMVEFQVPGSQASLWLVAGPEEVQTLMAEGVKAGRIWTVAEMVDFLQAPGMTSEEALKVARLRQVFNATIVDIRPAEPTEQAPQPDEAREPEQRDLDLGFSPQEYN